MFPTRGLLQHVECPDHAQSKNGCGRPACPFRHSTKPPSAPKRKISEETEKGEGEDVAGNVRQRASKVHLTSATTDQDAAAAAERRRATFALPSVGQAPPRNTYDAALRAQGQSGTVQGNTAARSSIAPSKAPSQSISTAPRQTIGSALSLNSSSSSSSGGGALSAPLIARSSHPSGAKVPLASRQSSLRTYFVTFSTLYAPLVPRAPPPPPSLTSPRSSLPDAQERRVHETIQQLVHRIASEDALASESDVFKTSNVNALSYRNSVRTTLVGIARRQKEDKEAQANGTTCIGTLGLEMQRKASRLDGELDELEQDEQVRRSTLEGNLIIDLRSSALIGSPAEYKKKQDEVSKRTKGRLTIERLEQQNMLATRSLLEATEYPLPVPKDSASSFASTPMEQSDMQDLIIQTWGLGGTKHTREGDEVVCERCGDRFVVKMLDENSEEKQACHFHWGRRRYVQEGGHMRGPRVPRWSCCNALDEGSAFSSTSTSQLAQNAGLLGAGASNTTSAISSSGGCQAGPHVFKEETSDILHRREAFMSTDAVMAACTSGNKVDAVPHPTYDVLAFDCELVYTTAGMSLARLTVLDESGKVVLDRFVQPRAAILDYNTRFSGITPKDVPIHPTPNAFTLDKARAALVKLMRPNSILVGHGLENDLKAVRLVHTRIIDSVFLYPHVKGLPFRMSLRELARVHLGKHIQLENDARGHDAEEDAYAALELIRLHYLRNGDGRITSKPPLPSSASTLPTPPRTSAPAGRPSAAQTPNNRRPNPTAGPSSAATASLFLPRQQQRK